MKEYLHSLFHRGEKGSVAVFFAIMFPALMWMMIYFENRMEVYYVTQEVQSILDISTTGATTAGVVYQTGNSKPFCTIPFRDNENENGDQVAVKLLQYNLKSLPIYVRNPIIQAINNDQVEGLKDAEEYAGGYSKLDLTFNYKPRVAYFFNTYKIHVSSRARCQADPDWTPESEIEKCTGDTLTPAAGTIQGPSGKETYYNLDMKGVVAIMRQMGNTDQYWIRNDGVKMLGDYIMVAADLSIRPRGSLIETSLGTGIVCDTGSFVEQNPTQLDIAVDWGKGKSYDPPFNPNCNGKSGPLNQQSIEQALAKAPAPSVEELKRMAKDRYGMDEQSFTLAFGWIAGWETAGMTENDTDHYADYLSACLGINHIRKYGYATSQSIFSGWGGYYTYPSLSAHVHGNGASTPYLRKLFYLAMTNLDTRIMSAYGGPGGKLVYSTPYRRSSPNYGLTFYVYEG